MNNRNAEEGFRLLVDKPAGMSSFGVVARVRRALSEKSGKKKVKVGHTGTLDPFATGLLVLMVGKETKKCGELMGLDKRYEATVRLGAFSTTGDVEGEIEEVEVAKDLIPNREKVEEVVRGFLGESMQKVPIFSAVKINGRRAYDLARKGEEVEMPKRKITVHDIKVVRYEWPELEIDCKVSSGTYIRALGEDIGKALGVGGYLTQLRRTEIGEMRVEDAESLGVY